MEVVPQFNFSADSNFGTLAQDGGFWEPTNELYRLTKTVAYGGSILPAMPPAINSSYELSIFAPYLGCTKADGDMRAAFSRIIDKWSQDNEVQLEYLAWVSELGDPSGSYNISIDALPVTLTDTTAQDPSQIFIFATLQEDTDETILGILTSCKLQNASYSLLFSFTNGVQSITVQDVIPTNDTFVNGGDENLPSSMPKWSYISLMMSYISVLIGSVIRRQDNSEWINGTTILSTNLEKYVSSEAILNSGNQSDQERSDAFQAELEELFFNMTFSMLNNPDSL